MRIDKTDKAGLIEKTLRLLEYGVIMDRAASRAMSEEAAAMIRSEKPLDDYNKVIEINTTVKAVLSRIRAGDNEPRSTLPSIGFLFPKLEVEGMALEIDEAYAIALFIERGEAIRKWLLSKNGTGDEPSAAKGGSPLVTSTDRSAAKGGSPLDLLLGELPGCGETAAEIFKVLDKEGKIRDLPSLRAIKKRLRDLGAELETAVSRYAADDESRRMLQSAVPSQRDGRTVLAVKANFRGRFRGIVHEVSSTGQTVFVEPEEAVEKNNEILIEKRNLDAEIHRILLELSGKIAGHRENLTIFHQALLTIECLRAKARYAYDTGGNFALSGENAGDGIILKQARHPLLKNPVPIDLEMTAGIRTLIITGPNTGGKTVALKTAGLFALMNQSGLALPAAEGTSLPVFDGVYADIGDEQSIDQSLSTFSAHITNTAGIIACSTERSLALLDELGSGTDPEEGSAIAMAILDYLIEKNSRLIITTHHGILKNYGYTRQGVENASVEFDQETLSPAYRIITGIPGESRALDIAARNGLPPEITAQARTYLDKERADVSSLIRGLKEKHRELDAAAEKTRAEETRLREERRRADLKELRLRQKEAELKAGAAGKLRSLLDESRKTLENLVREVREGELSREKTLKVKEFLGELAHNVDAENAALDEEERALADERRRMENADGEKTQTEMGPVVFASGMEVLAGENKRRGVILRPGKKGPSGNTWVVEIGSLKISFHEKDLVPAAPSKTELRPFTAVTELASSPVAAFEINLLGMRLTEALDALRRQIDAAALSGLKEFSVVHGKGDGILQKGVHDYLKKESAVADYYFSRPELGGFGRTEVILR